MRFMSNLIRAVVPGDEDIQVCEKHLTQDARIFQGQGCK